MLELIQVTKAYGNRKVVQNLSLHVHHGEIMGLLGPNGAGKSTTVSMISTISEPDRGDIRVNQQTVKGRLAEVKKIMGVVPQDLALYEALSAQDNLEFFGSLHGMRGQTLRDRAQEVLELMGLHDKRNQSVGEFSGGMKRRINIGIALMHRPQLLILDEPTVGIDPQSRNHILEMVKQLSRDQGTTIIYTSHYMEEVEYLCDRVAIMDHGRLIACGTKQELKQQSEALDILTITYQPNGFEDWEAVSRIGGIQKMELESSRLILSINTAIGSVIDILDALRTLGVQMSSFQYEEVNLEHVFLQMTGKSLRD
ncbi:ABC transporter ATP-binding protein [Paenibacillus sp. JJ-223]|uniref:ABC transporter ATP-binding protein n=1 Tax=Paenibacillus sp. JJ-223 TaxID=2905647 RepID=UPI001F1C1AB7|nr:ABC transporter ATP-binding protein [Paenibacillus sp. JJ-223]CAH1191312.1 Linearmycin resistance ATP-binding protein LnrL [Paenibacillus sp. JJ-223]